MNQLYPDAGLLRMLNKLVGVNGLVYHLFTNNITPDLDTELGDLTEATWTGYASARVFPADFTTQSVVSHLGSIIAAPVAFLNSSGSSKTAYGYFITDFDTGDLIGVARFDSAPVTIANGASQQVIPILADFSGLAS